MRGTKLLFCSLWAEKENCAKSKEKRDWKKKERRLCGKRGKHFDASLHPSPASWILKVVAISRPSLSLSLARIQKIGRSHTRPLRRIFQYYHQYGRIRDNTPWSQEQKAESSQNHLRRLFAGTRTIHGFVGRINQEKIKSGLC